MNRHTCTASMVFLKAHVSAPDTVGIPFPSLRTTANDSFFAAVKGSRSSRLCPVENTDRYSGTFLMNPSGQPSSASMVLEEDRKGKPAALREKLGPVFFSSAVVEEGAEGKQTANFKAVLREAFQPGGCVLGSHNPERRESKKGDGDVDSASLAG